MYNTDKSLYTVYKTAKTGNSQKGSEWGNSKFWGDLWKQRACIVGSSHCISHVFRWSGWRQQQNNRVWRSDVSICSRDTSTSSCSTLTCYQQVVLPVLTVSLYVILFNTYLSSTRRSTCTHRVSLYLILFNTYLHCDRHNKWQRSFSTWMSEVRHVTCSTYVTSPVNTYTV